MITDLENNQSQNNVEQTYKYGMYHKLDQINIREFWNTEGTSSKLVIEY